MVLCKDMNEITLLCERQDVFYCTEGRKKLMPRDIDPCMCARACSRKYVVVLHAAKTWKREFLCACARAHVRACVIV